MKQLFLVLAGATLLFSCKKETNNSGVYKGLESEVYDGKAWSAVRLSQDGKPQQLTLSISNTAINSVPVGGEPGTHEEESFLVPLHAEAMENTPFQFIMLDWNPEGHDPSGIYDLPHFDMHFYMSSFADVMTFTDMTKIETAPGESYVPANYVGGPSVPAMGKHWVDITSPEFNGQTFTQTFIYGSYDGKIAFYEPMITLDFLKNTNNFERSIPQPAKFKTAGYYPTKMRIVKHADVTEIVLDEFVYRQAS